MKKMFGIMLVTAMIVSFTACGGSDIDKFNEQLPQADVMETKVAQATPEELATETAEKAMSAFCEMDLEGMMKVFDTEESAEELPFKNKEDLYDMFMETMAEDGDISGFEDMIKPLAESVVDAFLNSINYEIKDVAELDGSYIFKIAFSSINFDNLPDFEAVLSTPEIESKVEELAIDLFEKGDITEDMSEDEMMKVMMPDIVDLIEEAVIGSIEDMTPVDAEGTLVVYEKDGKWLVNDEKSDFDEIVAAMGSF